MTLDPGMHAPAPMSDDTARLLAECKREAEAARAARRATRTAPGHDPTWRADQGRFFAVLADLGLRGQYEVLAQKLLLLGLPRPSGLTRAWRDHLLSLLPLGLEPAVGRLALDWQAGQYPPKPQARNWLETQEERGYLDSFDRS